MKTRLFIWGDNAIIKIGSNCCLNGVNICARERVEIGDNSIFATGIQIIDSDSHIVSSTTNRKEKDNPSPVLIGKNVWVGLNAIILKGTIIGNNCVVGAGSVVKGIFPDNSVIVGNPAKIIKTFNLEQ